MSTSPFVYQKLHKYNHPTKRNELVDEVKLIGKPEIKSNNFEVQQCMVPSHDGELIPMNIYHKKGIKLNRKNKVLLEGYGAYGMNMH